MILALNLLIVELRFRSRRLRRLVEAQPTLLVRSGRVLHENLARERLTLEDLHAALRRSGVADVGHVRVAVLEDNAGISVIPRAGLPPGEFPGALTVSDDAGRAA